MNLQNSFSDEIMHASLSGYGHFSSELCYYTLVGKIFSSLMSPVVGDKSKFYPGSSDSSPTDAVHISLVILGILAHRCFFSTLSISI